MRVDSEWFKRFLIRLSISTLCIALFFIAIQDFLVFPMLWAYPAKWFYTSTTPQPLIRHLIQSKDGTKIEVFEHPPATKEMQGAAIMFHGNGLPASNFIALQKWFSLLGIRSYMIEYRGYGGTSGWPLEESLYQDADAVWEFVRQSTGLPKDRLVVFGMSIGSGLAAYLAAHQQPRALVLLSAYSSLADVARETPLLGLLAPLFHFEFPVTEHLSELSETCIISAHGRKDTVVPFTHQDRLAAVLRNNTNFVRIILPDAGHNDVFQKAVPQITQALRQCLPAT
jgi:pimeloyl-ACP methyl ester carboxylesterase